MVMNLQEYALFLKGYAHGVFDSNPYLAHATITAEGKWADKDDESGVKLSFKFRPPSLLAGDGSNSATFILMIGIKAIEDNRDKQAVLDYAEHFSKQAWEAYEKDLDRRAAAAPMQHAIAAMQRPNVIRVGAHLDEV